MSRLYGDKVDLDYGKVHGFFERRSARIAELGPLSVTMYQSQELAARRDTHEKAAVAPHLRLAPDTRVLDVACGTGRWGLFLEGRVASYLGTDLCEPYVAAANDAFRERGADPDRFHCQTLPASQLDGAVLEQPPPFDLIIVAGLLPFLNDPDVEALFRFIREIASPGATVYVREPVGVSTRLTLRDFPSEELGDEYHAIYRTRAELEALFDATLLDGGGSLLAEFALFPPDLRTPARRETDQHVFILSIGEPSG